MFPSRDIYGHALLTIALLSPIESVQACSRWVPFDPKQIASADAIVIGKIKNYRIVQVRKIRRERLADRNLSARERARLTGDGFPMSDYARFDVEVDQVLSGSVARRATVTLIRGTFDLPAKFPVKPFLIVLRRDSLKKSRSETAKSVRAPTSLTVLQVPCSAPYIFESSSEQARAIRFGLAARNK